MRIVLANFHNHQTNSAMYGLVALASYLEKENIDVQVIDANRQPLYNIISSWKPDIIGLTSYTVWYGDVVREAHKIKDMFPHIKTVIGGHHITSLPNSIRNPPFDYGIIGEGEDALANLCKGVPLEQIKGVIDGRITGSKDTIGNFAYHSNPVDVDKLPVVRLDKYTPIDFYKDGMVGLVASRGCSFNCKYCAIRTMTKGGVRYYPVDIILEQIQLCYDKLGSRTIIFWDDTWATNLDWLKTLVNKLEQKNLLGKINYHVHMRSSIVNEERCELMKKMGVKVWNIGWDSGDDEILKNIKGNDCSVEKNKNAILMARKYGIATGGSVIFGMPNEKIESMKKTLAFIEWYAEMIEKGLASGSIWGFVAVPLPGTPWWRMAEEKGKVSWDMDCGRLSLHNWKEHFLLDESVTEEQFNWIHEEFKKLMIRINGSWGEP